MHLSLLRTEWRVTAARAATAPDPEAGRRRNVHSGSESAAAADSAFSASHLHDKVTSPRDGVIEYANECAHLVMTLRKEKQCVTSRCHVTAVSQSQPLLSLHAVQYGFNVATFECVFSWFRYILL